MAQVRLDKDVEKDLKTVKEKDTSRRSLAQLVNWLLREALKKISK